MKTFILLLLNILFNSTANVMIKRGTGNLGKIKFNHFDTVLRDLLFNPFLILGCICFALSLIFYTFVLKKLNLNIAYPITVSGSVLLVTLFSKILLYESFSIMQACGVLVILLGIFMIVH